MLEFRDSIVGRVADEKGERDEVGGIRESSEVLEVLVEPGGGVLERGEDEDLFLGEGTEGGRFDGGEVVRCDGGVASS